MDDKDNTRQFCLHFHKVRVLSDLYYLLHLLLFHINSSVHLIFFVAYLLSLIIPELFISEKNGTYLLSLPYLHEHPTRDISTPLRNTETNQWGGCTLIPRDLSTQVNHLLYMLWWSPFCGQWSRISYSLNSFLTLKRNLLWFISKL